ncbi:hypothetical protein ACM74C_08210 [Pseudomonas aeruginosa]
MNSGMKVGLGRPDSASRVLCVSTNYIQNIRNIKKTQEKYQQKQSLTSENLFHLMENKQKQTGTNSGTQVLAVFRNPTFSANGCSPSAVRPAEESQKSAFRLLPVAPEHLEAAVSPEFRGIQQSGRGAVPDVPNAPWAYAGFSFFAPFRLPLRCPPWPS